MRSCNLELQLLPPCCDDLFSKDHISTPHDHFSMLDVVGERSKDEQQQQQQQKLTIFYNGKMSVCDVNELQAKAIIMVAKRESEKRSKSNPSTSIIHVPVHQQNQQLNMKKSFQRFLQNRKNRIRSGSPY